MTKTIKPKRNSNKTIIVDWFIAHPEDAKLPWEKSIKAFKKQHPEIREIAFKDYHKKINEGSVELVKVAPSMAQIKTSVVLDLKDVSFEMYKTGVITLPKNIFVPWKMNKPVDQLFSDDGGVMKGTINICDGGPSVGKSTVVYSWASALKEVSPKLKICCLQSEMKTIELEYEALRKSWMSKIEFVVLNDERKKFRKKLIAAGKTAQEIEALLSMHYLALIQKVFSTGFDMILIDSYHDIVSKMKDFCDMTEGQAERELLGLIDAAADGENDTNTYTSFIIIQQVGKGGIHKGSNQLKHAVQAWFHFRFDEKKDRYLESSKNRRNGKNTYKRMYYWLDDKGEVQYDEKTFTENLKIEAEVAAIKGIKGDFNFDEVFTKDLDRVGSSYSHDGADDDAFDDEDDD